MNKQDVYIRNYKVLGLHGDKDIELDFNEPYKIIIAENGTGKTTVLNMLFYAISGEIQRLAGVDFESLSISFTNGITASLNKSDVYLEVPEEIRERIFFRRLEDNLGEELAWDLVTTILNSDSPREVRNKAAYFRARASFTGSHAELSHYIQRLFGSLKSEDLFSDSTAEFKKIINDNLNLEILYLPTYRRVEEDLQRLGYEGEFSDSKEQLIHFGMRDVSRRFREITEEIRESAVSWYSKISGRMLDELMDGTVTNRDSLEKISDLGALEIVLDRIGQNITKERKTEIVNLAQSGSIHENKYEVLAYFLSNLVEIYDQQREKDNRIKDFVNIASKYLVGKEVIYDESNVTITIVNTRTQREVQIEKLSSGEKQLISILSKLYLESGGPTLIIFDEPELSLSIDWQKNLLPDIIASGRCKMLIAATHSPFIFDNEMDKYAEALSVSYREAFDERAD